MIRVCKKLEINVISTLTMIFFCFIWQIILGTLIDTKFQLNYFAFNAKIKLNINLGRHFKIILYYFCALMKIIYTYNIYLFKIVHNWITCIPVNVKPRHNFINCEFKTTYIVDIKCKLEMLDKGNDSKITRYCKTMNKQQR